MEELIKSFRLGVVQVFGLIVPGLALLPSFAYLLCLEQRTDKCFVLPNWGSHRIEFAAAVLTLAYVLGFIVRLIPMESLDWLSRGWLNRVGKWRGRDKALPLNGPYPYKNLAEVLEMRGLGPLCEYVTWGDRGGRGQINSLKLLVASKNQTLANSLASIEASIRMMFGLFITGLTALGVLIGSQLSGQWPADSMILFWLLVATITCSLFVIFNTFTQMRYTELAKLLMALKLCAAEEDTAVDNVIESFKNPQQSFSATDKRKEP